MTRLKKYLVNGALMTASALVLRGLSVLLNSYVSRRIGAEALGLYTLLGSVYSLALTLALSGINLSTTRLVSDAMGEGNTAEARAAMRRCVIYSLFFGSLSSVLLLMLSEPLAMWVLRDIRTLKPLRLCAATLPLIALTSCLNGYFTAVRRVYKNVIAQISEQASRLGFCVLLLELIMGRDMESCCTALVLGGALAEMLSFTISLLLFIVDRIDRPTSLGEEKPICERRITKKLLSIALPLAFSTYFRSALLTLEHILIPRGIERSGSDRAAALASYGALQSMAMPLVLLPAALIQSFSGLLVPELAELRVRGERGEIRYVASRVCHLALLFAIGAAAIMVCFAPQLGEAVYSSAEAGRYIRLVACIVPIMYLDTTVDSMLKGLGEHLYTMAVNIIDTLCSLLMVWLLIPRLGIYGYIALIIISEIFNATASVMKLVKVTGMRLRIGKCFVLPALSAAISTVSVTALSNAVNIGLACSIALSAMAYLALLCLTGALDAEDICWIRKIFKKSP